MTLSVYLLQIGSPELALLYKIIPRLPCVIKNKIARFRFAQEQWLALLSELLTRKVLSEEISLNPKSLNIEIDNFGKPFIRNHPRYFNLSHSKNYIFFATDVSPIGVDIEFVKKIEDLDKLIKTCLSKEEQENYFNQKNEQRLEHFYEIWTLKESYIKAIGQGLSCPLQSFSIKSENEHLYLNTKHESNINWHLKSYFFNNQYKAAVCAQSGYFPKQPLIISVSEVLDLIEIFLE